jgi:hypothetical protein
MIHAGLPEGHVQRLGRWARPSAPAANELPEQIEASITTPEALVQLGLAAASL